MLCACVCVMYNIYNRWIIKYWWNNDNNNNNKKSYTDAAYSEMFVEP